ncbi:hypothetical protein G7046_g1995 [Stylonectria norvegica]|nr:hypothetical protein G7046_g1995 [Stylonectria norvegica]
MLRRRFEELELRHPSYGRSTYVENADCEKTLPSVPREACEMSQLFPRSDSTEASAGNLRTIFPAARQMGLSHQGEAVHKTIIAEEPLDFPLKNPQEACLLRYFVEELSHWFDLCDESRHFQLVVPLRARKHPPLLHAIFAVAARHLTRLPQYQTPQGILYQGQLLPTLTQHHAVEYMLRCIPALREFHNIQDDEYLESIIATAVILRQMEEIDDEEDVSSRPTGLGQSYGGTRSVGQVNFLAIIDAVLRSLPSQTLFGRLSLIQAAYWMAVRQEIYHSFTRKHAPKMALDPEYGHGTSEANKIVIHTAQVAKWRWADGSELEWLRLQEQGEQLDGNALLKFQPFFTRSADRSNGEIFPIIWTQTTSRTRWREIETEVRQMILDLCGISICHPACPPALVHAAIGMDLYGDFFTDQYERRALRGFVEKLRDARAWPVQKLSDMFRPRFPCLCRVSNAVDRNVQTHGGPLTSMGPPPHAQTLPHLGLTGQVRKIKTDLDRNKTGSTRSGVRLGRPGAAKPTARLDGVGIFWITFLVAWTLLLAGGMAFLYRRRDMPMLRIRGLPLSFCAVIFLHLYWAAVQAAYVYGPLAPPSVEYWIMSIWLPCGIAMFHASNSRFLHVAKTQKKFFASATMPTRATRNQRATLLGRFRGLDYTHKMLLFISIGMCFQLCLTVFMFLISRKFHHSFGIPGTETTGTDTHQKSQMSRGWEWWPSVFWQFFWAWIVAPVILWQARGIRDTQGWRVQTIACSLASLHATPMWLVALYVPAMAPINNVFIPPQWIAISIMMLEILTIFMPCWEVLRHQTLRQETLDSIAQWESNNKALGKGSRSVATGSTTMAGSALTSWTKDGSIKTTSGESILTMGALEYVLERNPEPLQQFSALRDFSGENIAFLRSVAEWKSSLPPSARDPTKDKDSVTQELVRERYNSALRIYTSFISSRDAEFQINLSSQDLKKLECIFEPSARVLYGEKRAVDPAIPFETFVTATKVTSSSASSHGSEKGIISDQVDDSENPSDKALYWGDIPDGFDETVFDDSEASIKYLVLTNTWPKFVKDRRCSLDSADAAESGNAMSASAR